MSEDHTPDAADEFLADAAEAEIAALKAEAAGLKEQALRYAAEAENTKRRAEREANDARAYAIQKFARDLLGVADILDRAMAAAPADYRPKDPGDHKRPRATGKLAVELEPTEDILSGTVSLRRPQAVIVGFALETGDADAKGAEKLRRKNLDLIVINDALEPGAGFEGDTNRVTILDKDGGRKAIPLADKREVADAILDAVEARLGK